jgi:hypothetical protein
MMGVAVNAARRLYNDVPVPTTKEFNLVATEFAQRNRKRRALDTSSVVDLHL